MRPVLRRAVAAGLPPVVWPPNRPADYVVLGLIGVPTTRVGETLYWGDDRLEEIAGVI